MATDGQRRRLLQLAFLPLMSPGHMIPMVDMAKFFAIHGGDDVSISIITTPGNEHRVRPSIDSLPSIQLHLVPFPDSVAHLLRDGKDNLASLASADYADFMQAFYALQHPIEHLLRELRPDCIISDFMFTWTLDAAAELNIPRIVFYGPGIFSACVNESLLLHTPHLKVADDSEVFVVEDLPHRIELTKPETSAALIYFPPEMWESGRKSHGVVVNSFYELEPEYAELYRKLGWNAYYVGPVSLLSRDAAADRGQKLDSKLEGLLSWLDSMEESSVLYVCFGSLNEFSAEQLREIALGLEESGRAFVWAVRGVGDDRGDWLPEGFEERMAGKGMLIRGWAPQVVILNHPAVGGFVTHCGWNSTLESATAGVPMVAWPVEYEQFANERLITQVLKIGVGMRREEAVEKGKGVVRAKEVAEAVREVMGEGEEAEGRRARARRYAEMAKAAVEEGGSSYGDVSRLIEDIRERRLGRPEAV